MLEAREAGDLLVQGLSVYTEQGEGAATARIENVDLRVSPGEWVTLVGVNGSGKSTLARLLAGLPQDGASGKMRRGFAGAGPAAYVMQQPDAQLFGETPREELAFALEWLGTPAEEMEGRIRNWLERAGLSALADEPWKRLSGGQRQLAAVAAATAGRSPLVVFDEATSMLDTSAAERVISMARELLAEGAAIVWVTQRLEELAPDMRVVAMKDGRIAFDGTGREFLYGRDPLREESPCVSCGLRLPYMAELALELCRLEVLAAPLPMTSDEWQRLTRQTTAELGVFEERASDDRIEVRNDASIDGGIADRTYDAVHLDKEETAAAAAVELSQRDGDAASELRLKPGIVTVLLGANGAGKTSLLEMMAGLRDPGELAVAYGEQPLWFEQGNGVAVEAGDSLRIGRLRGYGYEHGRKRRAKRKLNSAALKRYGYASQAPEEQLINRTAEQEFQEVLRPYRLDQEAESGRMSAALEAVGWDETWLSKDPYRMSGGERRRLALACLYAVPASWMLIDEPTAGLDAAGQRLAAERLERCRGSDTGVLLVSHDTEWALPLADRVLLLSREGQVRACSREQLLLHPEWWNEAGMEIPAWLTAITPLMRFGVSPDSVWHPSELAREWRRICTDRAAAKPETREQPAKDKDKDKDKRPQLQNGSTDLSFPLSSDSMDQIPPQTINLPRSRNERTDRFNRTPLIALDPRSAWLAYVLLSLAIFTLRSWSGLAAAGVVTIAAVLIGRIPLRRWQGLIVGYLLFSLIVSLVAGIGGGTFMLDAFLTALKSLVQTLLVMLLGLGLALAITPLRLRRSLEQLLSFRGQTPFAAQKFVLTITLMLRFIPLFLDEWSRFARYGIARSKEASLTLRSATRRLRTTALPFLLSLFRLSDQVADSLESRGVGRRRRKAVLRTLRWRKRDTALAFVALAVSLALWLCK